MASIQQAAKWKRVGSCAFAIRDRVTKRWPCYGRVGQFCLTPPADWDSRKPREDAEWFSVTHQPSGFRGGDVMRDDPNALRILATYARIFGKATTIEGIMRKYRRLSPAKKRWLKQQTAWAKKGK